MRSKSITSILSLLILIILVSNLCLSASENNPRENNKIVGLSLFPPAGENWHHETVHPARIEFGKLGNNNLQSLVASAVTHKLPPAASEEEFLQKVSEERWGEIQAQVRFITLLNEEKITHEKGTLCIRYHTKYEDHGSKYLTKEIPFFIVEDMGLICRHPENTEIGVSIGISQRAIPDKLIIDFNKLADVFLFKAEFEPLPDDL